MEPVYPVPFSWKFHGTTNINKKNSYNAIRARFHLLERSLVNIYTFRSRLFSRQVSAAVNARKNEGADPCSRHPTPRSSRTPKVFAIIVHKKVGIRRHQKVLNARLERTLLHPRGFPLPLLCFVPRKTSSRSFFREVPGRRVLTTTCPARLNFRIIKFPRCGQNDSGNCLCLRFENFQRI